jgi:molybdopterin synthase catalytic subunit
MPNCFLQVVRLEYEAYEPMALAEMKKICTELRAKWSLEHIGIIHRYFIKNPI